MEPESLGMELKKPIFVIKSRWFWCSLLEVNVKEHLRWLKDRWRLPWWHNGKESACNAGDLGSIPALGRSRGEGNGYLLPYSCLENSMDRGAWRATAHRVTKSQTWLKQLSSSSRKDRWVLFSFYFIILLTWHCDEIDGTPLTLMR